jgi:hypothetical protein
MLFNTHISLHCFCVLLLTELSSVIYLINQTSFFLLTNIVPAAIVNSNHYSAGSSFSQQACWCICNLWAYVWEVLALILRQADEFPELISMVFVSLFWHMLDSALT